MHVVGGQPQPTLACLRRPNSYACLLVRAMRPARDETLGHRCSPCVACASVPHALDQLVPHPCQFDHILTCTLGVCMQSNAVTCSHLQFASSHGAWLGICNVGHSQREDSECIIAMASRLSRMCAWARRLGSIQKTAETHSKHGTSHDTRHDTSQGMTGELEAYK